MNDLLGIDAARKIRSLHYNGQIVFLTSSPDFAVDGYDVEAAGYLLKPLSQDKLSRVMARILLNSDSGIYQVRQRSNVIQIPYHDILFVESRNSKCILHRNGGVTYTIYKHLSQIEEELSDIRFLRCHQSYLVNMDYIDQVDKQFHLNSGDTVLIRQRDLRAIRQSYLDYLKLKQVP